MRISAAPRRLAITAGIAVAAVAVLTGARLATGHHAPGVPVAAGTAGAAGAAAVQPQAVAATSVPADFTVERDIRYLPNTDRYGLLDAYLPPTGSERAWVLVLHGGSWSSGDKRDVNAMRAVDTFTTAGYVVFSANYPLSTDFPGYAGVSWDAQRAAVDSAVEFVEHGAALFGIDPGRGVLYGFSAGGNLAASVATLRGTSLVRAFVTASGVMEPQNVQTDTLRMWAAIAMRCPYLPTWTSCAARWHDAEPITHVTADVPPALLFAGDNDDRVPYQGSVRLADAINADGGYARVIVAHGTGHEDLSWYDNPENTATMLEFVSTYTS
jgi:acetyl esterase/lipase